MDQKRKKKKEDGEKDSDRESVRTCPVFEDVSSNVSFFFFSFGPYKDSYNRSF